MRKQLGVTAEKLEKKGGYYLSVLIQIFKYSQHMLDNWGYGLCEQLE